MLLQKLTRYSLYGPAPLHHALLDGDTHTGLTVQTLHPTKMDAGAILAQTPSPGLPIPNHSSISITDFQSYMAPLGAELLLRTLREGLFVAPIVDLAPTAQKALQDRGGTIRHARKLGIEDRHIDWSTWDAGKILRRRRLLGKLWNVLPPRPATNTKPDALADQEAKVGTGSTKIVWSDEDKALERVTVNMMRMTDKRRAQKIVEESFRSGVPEGILMNITFLESHWQGNEIPPGLAWTSPDRQMIYVNTVDGKILRASKVTVAGDRARAIEQVDARHGIFDRKPTAEGPPLKFWSAVSDEVKVGPALEFWASAPGEEDKGVHMAEASNHYYVGRAPFE